MKKSQKFLQGFFTPKNPSKYIGNHKPRFLSSYELKFMRWADKNPNVLKWGSENISIPYVSPLDRKMHFYMVDNFVLFKTKDGKEVKYLIEIKPEKQTRPPVTKNRKNKRHVLYEQVMFAKNTSKWNAAREWCRRNDCQFVILTEQHLDIKR